MCGWAFSYIDVCFYASFQQASSLRVLKESAYNPVKIWLLFFQHIPDCLGRTSKLLLESVIEVGYAVIPNRCRNLLHRHIALLQKFKSLFHPQGTHILADTFPLRQQKRLLELVFIHGNLFAKVQDGGHILQIVSDESFGFRNGGKLRFAQIDRLRGGISMNQFQQEASCRQPLSPHPDLEWFAFQGTPLDPLVNRCQLRGVNLAGADGAFRILPKAAVETHIVFLEELFLKIHAVEPQALSSRQL